MKKERVRLAGTIAFVIALAACGGGTKVGTAFKNFQGQSSGGRIGALDTPSAKPQATTAGQTPRQPAVQPGKPKQTPAPKQQSSLAVRITSTGFDPTAARVYTSSLISVTNSDAQPHSYTSSDGTYDSGSLAPGQSKNFQATVAGKFQMTDRTRNWIIGSLEVVAR